VRSPEGEERQENIEATMDLVAGDLEMVLGPLIYRDRMIDESYSPEKLNRQVRMKMAAC
jgi:hypothetical protein